MPITLLVSISGLIALVPAALLPYRGGRRDVAFWALLGVALAGSLAVVGVLFAGGWRTGLGSALWLTIATGLALFAAYAATTGTAWRLAPLLLPYLALLALLATVLGTTPEQPLEAPLTTWPAIHIAFGLLAYGLLTLGAVAGAAVFVQERALKAKRPNALSRMLPAVTEGEALQTRLLTASAVMLSCGVVTGMASQYVIDGTLLAVDHKTVLSLAALVVVAALLVTQAATGLRGRRAARVVLLAWLLMTLAYPGVKFVADVLIG